jgi:hypothetical protein
VRNAIEMATRLDISSRALQRVVAESMNTRKRATIIIGPQQWILSAFEWFSEVNARLTRSINEGRFGW